MARATSKGRAASYHSPTKRPSAPASGVLNAADLAITRRTPASPVCARSRASGAEAGRAAQERANPAGDDEKVDEQVPQHQTEEREGEHVDAAGAVQRRERESGGEAQHDQERPQPIGARRARASTESTTGTRAASRAWSSSARRSSSRCAFLGKGPA